MTERAGVSTGSVVRASMQGETSRRSKNSRGYSKNAIIDSIYFILHNIKSREQFSNPETGTWRAEMFANTCL